MTPYIRYHHSFRVLVYEGSCRIFINTIAASGVLYEEVRVP